MAINQITALPSNDGVERMSAIFQGFSFSRHRHDTYAVGMTTGGIQAFTYRGAARHSIRGQTFVLHPDEQHDGRAGDARGFSYHIAYIDPSLILAASEGKSLPFVREPVSNHEQLCDAVRDLLSAPHDVEGELATACSIVALSDILLLMAGSASTRRTAIKCSRQIWIEQERAISESDRAIEVADQKAKRMRPSRERDGIILAQLCCSPSYFSAQN